MLSTPTKDELGAKYEMFQLAIERLEEQVSDVESCGDLEAWESLINIADDCERLAAQLPSMKEELSEVRDYAMDVHQSLAHIFEED